ncbi:MAG: hypothetical protein GC190_07015 [Alphaproteobacteria bacterium]|nr:hypothetical protein [Alphaproteobacteria bacterium]
MQMRLVALLALTLIASAWAPAQADSVVNFGDVVGVFSTTEPVRLDQFSGDDLFRQDASFYVRPGLADGSLASFESVNYPGYYLRHRNFHLFLEQGSDELFRSDATFYPEPGLASERRRGH